MPRTQVAQVPVHDVSAPAVEAVVLTFRVRGYQGGIINILAEAPNSSVNVEYTVQVSADGTTYYDTTAALNGQAVANITLIPRGKNQHDIILRQGTDNYMRVQAVGGDRFQMQFRGEELLEIVTV